MGRRGSIWFRSSRGEWFATINGKQTALGPDKAKAEREFHRLKSRAAPIEQETVKVWVLVERYLDRAEQDVAAATFQTYRYALVDWSRFCGSLPAADVRPYHVDDWIESHRKWNPSTRALNIRIIKIWSAWCARKGYLDVERLHLMRAGTSLKREPVPRATIRAALKAIIAPEFRDFFVLCWETGARPGEIRTLESSRIDFKSKTATVRGKRGPRVIGLTRAAIDVLRRNARRWPDGPVLRNTLGNGWTTSALVHHFQAVRKRIGDKRLVLYHARHDFYGRANKAGAGDVIISNQLGHTLRQLASTYAHSDASELASLVEAASTSGPESKRVARSARARAKRSPRSGKT